MIDYQGIFLLQASREIVTIDLSGLNCSTRNAKGLMGWQKYFVITFSVGWVVLALSSLLIHFLGLRLPAFAELKQTSQGITYLDRTGQPLLVQKRETAAGKSTWVEIANLDPHLVQAVAEQPNLSVAVVRFFDGTDPLKPHQSWFQRGKSRLLARALRHRWTSVEIVEAYLNLAYFRRDIRGISAATFEIFEKSPQLLTRKEIQTLISLLRAPLGRRAFSRRHPGLAVPSFYEDQARAHGHVTGTVPLTLDVAINKDALAAMKHYGGRKSAGLLVIDNASGEILSAIGDVEKVHMARSILNPWLYGLALDRGVVSMASWLHDAPLSMVHDRSFRETVSVREALENSLSIPTVQVLDLIGVDQYVDVLRSLKLKSVPTAALAGPSLVMDGPVVSLLEVANAYRAFANHGVYSAAQWRKSTRSPVAQRILNIGASYLIEESLGRHAQIPTAPLWTGIKHISESEGEWCVGFSDTYTVAVWMPSNVGFQVATSVWLEVMRGLHKQKPSHAPVPPQDLVRRELKLSAGKSVTEFFLAGTEFLRGREVGSMRKSRIVYPVDQAELNLDKVSPGALQKVFFQAHPANSEDLWVLNGRTIGSVREFTAWIPEAGRFELEIRDAQGHTVDSVRFKVRTQQESTWPITQKTTISEKPKRGAL